MLFRSNDHIIDDEDVDELSNILSEGEISKGGVEQNNSDSHPTFEVQYIGISNQLTQGFIPANSKLGKVRLYIGSILLKNRILYLKFLIKLLQQQNLESLFLDLE